MLQVRADLGFRVDAPETDRLLDPALGGGALLDMGVYPLTFADLFLGEPERVATAATLSGSGIDLDVALALGYAGGAVAALTASMTAPTPRSASIATDRGRIDVPAPFHHPGVATDPHRRHGGRRRVVQRGRDRHRPRPRGGRGDALPAVRGDREPAGASRQPSP